MYKINRSKMKLAMLAAGIDSARQLAGLAGLAGVSTNTLSRINNGCSAKIPTVQALANALKVDPIDLIEEAED